ncbi:hypothetical protein B0H13DRAFT_1899849 [Mycena leptocephala]|nr:hypothetical protein B0H13DRAFT_1899849 [Mycena leptocephala]
MLAKSLTNQTLSGSSEEDTQPFSKPVHPNLHAHIVDVSGHRESEVDARNILPETSACSRAPTTPQCAAEEAIEERSTKKVEKPYLHDSYDSDSGPFIYVVCIYTLRASGGATTIVVGGTITAGVVTDGTTMIVAEADKEAGVAGMMIGGIRYLFILLLSPPVARVAGILFLSGELDIPKLQTFVAAGDRYPLAVNWTTKFATTGAPFSLRISESSSAKPGNFHAMEDAGVRVADQRDARALHKRTTGRLFSFNIRHSSTSDCDDACFATGIYILLLRQKCTNFPRLVFL